MTRWLVAGTRLATLSIVLGAMGCRAMIPDGRFGCTESEPCPDGFSCVESVCRRASGDFDVGSGDGGVPEVRDTGMLDNGMLDTGMLDTGMLDAGHVDTATPDAPGMARTDAARPHTLRVLDAVEDVDGRPVSSFRVTYGGESRELSFGCVTTFTVPASASSASLSVEIAGSPPTEHTVLADDDVLVVLARSESGVGHHVLVDDEPSPGTVRYLDVLRSDGLALSLAPDSGASGVAVTFGAWTPEQEARGATIATVRPPLALTPVLVASFTYAAEGVLAVLTGDGRRHPGAPGGPRLVLVPAGAEACGMPLLPDPQVLALNIPLERNALGGGQGVFVCQLRASGAAGVDAGDLSPVFSAYGGRSVLGFSDRDAAACGSSARLLDLAAEGALVGHRYLAVVSGTVAGRAPLDWRITLMEEPTPPGDRPTEIGAAFLHAAPSSISGTVDVLNDDDGSVLVDSLASLDVATATTSAPSWTHGIRLRDHATQATIERYGAAGGMAMAGGSFVVFADTRLSLAPLATWAFTVRAPFLDHGSVVERRPAVIP